MFLDMSSFFLPYSNMAVFDDYLNDSLINFIRDFVSA